MENIILLPEERFSAIINNAVKEIKEFINSSNCNSLELLSSKEIMKRINVSPNTLQKMRDNGEIPFIKRNGKILYDLNDVMIALKNNGKNV